MDKKRRKEKHDTTIYLENTHTETPDCENAKLWAAVGINERFKVTARRSFDK